MLGTRDKRGDWKPNKLVTNAPLFVLPPRPIKLVRWFFGYPGYLLPWNLLLFAIAAALWFLATPSMSTMKTLAAGWILFLLIRNAVLVFAWYGLFHLRLYVRRSQSNRFKYNAKWLATDNKFFLFRNQTKDNMFWTMVSGVSMWTAYEVLTLWAFANGHLPYLDPGKHPVWFVVVLVLVPLFREFHFFWVHRLLHWPPLYKVAHSLHHKNVNPGPWSGLAMHPVEHLLYYSCVLVHWVVPSHPIHAMFNLVHAALSPAPGHTGFDKIELSGDAAVDTNGMAHYLHHKYFEVNYADGAIPLDRLFGSFHDGSPSGDEAMQRRLVARMQKRRPAA
jgi:sterol desaturase/sphingolipid hydroxylase (fatty acid hydroxylase superfamily)